MSVNEELYISVHREMDYQEQGNYSGPCIRCDRIEWKSTILTDRAAVGDLKKGQRYCHSCIDSMRSPCGNCGTMVARGARFGLCDYVAKAIKWVKICDPCNMNQIEHHTGYPGVTA